MYELDRRALLYGLAATSAIGGAPKAAHGAAHSATLRNVAAHGGLTYGAAISEGLLAGVPEFAAQVGQQCRCVVPENDGKWKVIHPSAHTYNFAPLDRITSFAVQHDMMTHGHTLVWHDNPAWLISALQNANQAQSLLTDHITTILSHYAGRIVSWDVVNEAIDPASGRADGLRDSPWLHALGPLYIQKAFEAARKADRKVKLVYNDYGIEYARPDHAVKRKLVLELVRNLRREGLIDALGIQSHLWLGEPFEPAVFAMFLREVESLGLEIYLSELDVNDNSMPADITKRDRAIASHLTAYLRIALVNKAVRRVVTWGLSTRYSWLNATPGIRRADGVETRGLPFDQNWDRSAMGDVLIRSFAARRR